GLTKGAKDISFKQLQRDTMTYINDLGEPDLEDPWQHCRFCSLLANGFPMSLETFTCEVQHQHQTAGIITPGRPRPYSPETINNSPSSIDQSHMRPECPDMDCVYPSAFNPCLLKCYEQEGKKIVALYNLTSVDTTFCQLSFQTPMFKGEGSIFICDMMEAKDSGLPYLIFVDMAAAPGEDIQANPFIVRHELIKRILQDNNLFDIHSPDNEFRLRAPLMFCTSDISSVFRWVLPNFYAAAKGIGFVRDTQDLISKKGASHADSVMIIRKTKWSDIYELFLSDGVTQVPGNNVAFIPNLDISKKMRDYLRFRTSAPIHCTFDEIRQKWIPLFE
ncbi:hypothetical protein HDV00_011772, partial [Rhizophlyctis rosea]